MYYPTPPTLSIPHFFTVSRWSQPRSWGLSHQPALSIRLTTHTGCKTCKGQEQGQHTQHRQPFLRLPTCISARPPSWVRRSLPRDLPTALTATDGRAGRARCRGRALPPERSVYATLPASCRHSPASWSLGWALGWPDRPWAATAASPGLWARHSRSCPLTSQGRAETLARASCFTAGPQTAPSRQCRAASAAGGPGRRRQPVIPRRREGRGAACPGRAGQGRAAEGSGAASGRVPAVLGERRSCGEVGVDPFFSPLPGKAGPGPSRFLCDPACLRANPSGSGLGPVFLYLLLRY